MSLYFIRLDRHLNSNCFILFFCFPSLEEGYFFAAHILLILRCYIFYLRIGIVSAGGRDCGPGGPGYRGEGPVRALDHVVQVDPVAVAE